MPWCLVSYCMTIDCITNSYMGSRTLKNHIYKKWQALLKGGGDRPPSIFLSTTSYFSYTMLSFKILFFQFVKENVKMHFQQRFPLRKGGGGGIFSLFTKKKILGSKINVKQIALHRKKNLEREGGQGHSRNFCNAIIFLRASLDLSLIPSHLVTAPMDDSSLFVI